MDTDERRAWGPLIREARKAQKLDQEELAKLAETTRRTIGSIERGDTVAQPKVLERILRALGLSDAPGLDADVNAFLAMVGPLLQRLDAEERARVMPAIVDFIVDHMKGVQPSNVIPFRGGLSAPQPTVALTEADLIGEPSVAEPERNDVEGDKDPEDT